MTDSCLVKKLGAYAELPPSDEDLLRELEKNERTYRKDQLVRRAGQPIEEFFVVKTGWLCSFSIMEDGRRQILRIFFPGDIVDLSETALLRANHDIKCLTAAILCPFPKAGLEPIFTTSPRLTALLFSMTVQEAAKLLERIRAVGRFSAYERICYLLLEISDRLRLTVPDVDEGFRLPLTQTDIADLLGLTNVYVSKTIARIERDRLIRRQGNRVMLLDLARLREACEYNRPTKIDTSWFPDVST
ncbi:MAG: Crp/Fnr family transcriptional regulator [Pseudomonadota bacterium]